MRQVREGQYIKHAQYGFGTITETDPDRTTIDFEAHGKKLFVTGLMSVEAAGDAPPQPAKVRRRKKAAAPKAESA